MQSMIWLLLTQSILALNFDCMWVILIYQEMGGKTPIYENCCKMFGVKCEGNKVTKLLWNNMKLTGSIPEEIGNLQHLEYL